MFDEGLLEVLLHLNMASLLTIAVLENMADEFSWI